MIGLDADATAHLNAINAMYQHAPWNLVLLCAGVVRSVDARMGQAPGRGAGRATSVLAAGSR